MPATRSRSRRRSARAYSCRWWTDRCGPARHLCVRDKIQRQTASVRYGERHADRDAIPAGLSYITIITHGANLTRERALALWDAGVDQFNISLDYLDERHDRARGIPGLTQKIFRTVDAMRTDDLNVRFNTVIKDDNLDELL